MKVDNYINRMREEEEELNQRIDRLIVFTNTPTFDELAKVEKQLLKSQLLAMTQYLNILQARLEYYEEREKNK